MFAARFFAAAFFAPRFFPEVGADVVVQVITTGFFVLVGPSGFVQFKAGA